MIREFNQLENKMNFGEKLKQLRHEQSWTQPDAAEAIGIEQSYLSKLENDKSQPSSEVFQQVLTAFKINVEDILVDLSPKAQRQLKSISEVSAYYAEIQKNTLINYRRWLIASFSLFSLGVLLFSAGFFKVIADDILYKYESFGVTKEGESINLFDNYTSLIQVLPSSEFKALKKDILLREDPIVFHTYKFRGEQFVEDVPGGKRLNYLKGRRTSNSVNFHAWFKVFGSLFLAMSIGCIFLSSRWR
jgi:transcriptional regulator with XRE-family HTH domain